VNRLIGQLDQDDRDSIVSQSAQKNPFSSNRIAIDVRKNGTSSICDSYEQIPEKVRELLQSVKVIREFQALLNPEASGLENIKSFAKLV